MATFNHTVHPSYIYWITISRRNASMNRSISPWQWLGFGFTSLGGTLLHFLYDWSGGNAVAAAFSAVNESTWEHMKLFFFPALFCYIALCIFKRNHEPCILYAFPKAIFLGTFLIPVLFYTYSGILGFHVSFLDISTFYVSVFFSFFYLSAHFFGKFSS